MKIEAMGVGKARAVRCAEVARMAEALLAVKMKVVATMWGDVSVDDSCGAVQQEKAKECSCHALTLPEEVKLAKTLSRFSRLLCKR